MRILDLDMDYFMTEVVHDVPETSTERLEEEYYAELEKFGLIDTEAHLLQGTKCDCCNIGKLSF